MCLFLGTMALLLSRPPGQRVFYQDGQYLVSVRYPGQWHDLRDFVQPSNPDVLAIFSRYGPDSWALYDFVCRNIDYRRDISEFWLVPSETLKGYADCEDTSILLTSLLRNFTNAYVALGSFQGFGHAWCQLNGEILETTYTHARQTAPRDYQLMALFNDAEVLELYPNSLAEVFGLARDEATKLKLIAQALGD